MDIVPDIDQLINYFDKMNLTYVLDNTYVKAYETFAQQLYIDIALNINNKMIIHTMKLSNTDDHYKALNSIYFKELPEVWRREIMFDLMMKKLI